EHINSNPKELECYFREALKHAKTNVEKSELYLVPIKQLGMHSKLKAVQLSFEALKYLGIELPHESKIKETVILKEESMEKKLEKLNASTMLQMPDTQVPEIKIAIELLTLAKGAAHFAGNEDLARFASLEVFELSLKYGNSRVFPRCLYSFRCLHNSEKF